MRVTSAWHRGKAWSRSQQCKRAGTPVIWDQATYTAVGKGDQWEEGKHVGEQFSRARDLQHCHEITAQHDSLSPDQ